MKQMKEKLLGRKETASGSKAVKDILEHHSRNPARVIGMLQDIQARFSYLPEGELRFVSEELGVPLTRIYAIATFYKAFNLLPRGRHQIRLCGGTACHVRGAELVKGAITRELGVEEGGTTEDARFSFEVVRCIGCCGQAPAMMVNEDIHVKLKSVTVRKALEKYK